MSELQAEQVERAPELAVVDDTENIMADLDAAFDAEQGYEDNIIPEKEPGQEPERELEDPDGSPDEPLAAEEPGESSIDYDLEIPMPDGQEPIKLGELKDKVTRLERSESQMIERENALMRQQDEVNQLLQAAGQLPPALREQAAQRMEQTLASERDAMLQAIPEWSDRETYDRDRTAILDVGKQYGFSDIEVGQIMDHRVVKFMRDHARLLNERQAAEKLPQQIKKTAKRGHKAKQRRGKSAVDKMFESALNSDNEQDKFKAIDNLLRG